MIYAAPSTTENSFRDGLTTGLAASLKWKLLAADGSVAIAEVTGTGITEIEPTVYRKQFTVPDTQGDYLIVWTNGSARITEELVVTSTAPALSAPVGSDLTTLASVREFLQKQGAEVTQDAVIGTLITRASQVMMAYAGREFAPATGGLTREFRYDGRGYLDFKRWDLRAATSVGAGARPDSLDPLTAYTDYALDPHGAPEGVYTGMYLGRSCSRPYVSIEGDWGFPAVPDDVQHWCNVTVTEWLRKDVSAFSTQYSIDESRLERPESLPAAARRGLNAYRRMVVW